MLRHSLKKLTLAAAASLLAMSASATKPQDPINLDQLLQQLQQGQFSQSEENKAREARFRQQEAQQKQILQEAIAQRNALEQQA